MTWWHDDMTVCFVLGCPVRRQSCNTTSSDPEINNVLTKDTAYTFSMCSGRYYLSDGIQHKAKYCYYRYMIYNIPCFLELCQEMSTNGSSPCKAWTFYPPQLCILSDSCSNNEDQAATSGDVDCPPGMEARKEIFNKLLKMCSMYLKIWTALKRAQHVFLNVEMTWNPSRMSPANCSVQVEIFGLLSI